MAVTEIIGSMLPDGSEFTQPLESEYVPHDLWKQECEAAMTAWKVAFEDIWPNLTVNFIPAENSDDGNELPNQIAPGDIYDLPHEKGLGDIRFAMHGPISALAYASFPTTPSRLGEVGTIGGDIHFDPTDSWRIDTDTTEMAYSIRRVAAHEIGHSLGLSHYHGNWQPQTDNNDNPVLNEGGTPAYIGQDKLMFPVSQHSYNLDVTIDQITKDALKALYTASDASTNLDGWDRTWYRWEKIAEQIEKSNNENIVINITYSYMPEGIPISVDRNMIATDGGPLEGCCVCCGANQANLSSRRGPPQRVVRGRDKQWDGRNSVGTSCYCGCCPCKPDDLTFRLLKCETVSINYDQGEWVRGECDALSGDDGMEFTLQKEGGPKQCKETQDYLKVNWEWNEGRITFPDKFARGCQGYIDSEGDYMQSVGNMYQDAEEHPEKYQEAWGFSGVLCEGMITTPDRPAYTFGESECLGMGILSTLCCCRTGNNSNYLEGLTPNEIAAMANGSRLWDPTREYYPSNKVREFATAGEDYRWETNPVWECVKKDPRDLTTRQTQGFKAVVDGETIWVKLYDKCFEGSECPPEISDDSILRNACPFVPQLDGTNHAGTNKDFDDGTLPLDPGQVHYDQYENCDWEYTDPDGTEYNWEYLTPTSPLECSMDCFSFNIRPDETKYEYKYLKPVVADGLDGRPLGNCGGGAGYTAQEVGQPFTPVGQPANRNQYAMSTGIIHSACSPCTYKQGTCSHDNYKRIFDPSMPLKGTLDSVGLGSTYGTISYDETPRNTLTDKIGFHYIISGQCRDNDCDNPQEFKLLVGGAWQIHCDCQTGVINTGVSSQMIGGVHYERGSSCYLRPESPICIQNTSNNAWMYDCKEDGCKCLGNPQLYGPRAGFTDRGLVLKNAELPCTPIDGAAGGVMWANVPQVDLYCPEDNPTNVKSFYTNCKDFQEAGSYFHELYRGCIPTYSKDGWEIVTDPHPHVSQAVMPIGAGAAHEDPDWVCDGVSWADLDWQNGTVVSSAGAEGSLPGACGYSEGDKQCWFNPSMCPYTLDFGAPFDTYESPFVYGQDGAICGDKFLNGNPGRFAGLSCGCGPDGKCASFCETATPVWMFYTGIIEEAADAGELQPTRMCTYNILAESYAQANTENI
jgi:hypothetical protein